MQEFDQRYDGPPLQAQLLRIALENGDEERACEIVSRNPQLASFSWPLLQLPELVIPGVVGDKLRWRRVFVEVLVTTTSVILKKWAKKLQRQIDRLTRSAALTSSKEKAERRQRRAQAKLEKKGWYLWIAGILDKETEQLNKVFLKLLNNLLDWKVTPLGIAMEKKLRRATEMMLQTRVAEKAMQVKHKDEAPLEQAISCNNTDALRVMIEMNLVPQTSHFEQLANEKQAAGCLALLKNRQLIERTYNLLQKSWSNDLKSRDSDSRAHLVTHTRQFLSDKVLMAEEAVRKEALIWLSGGNLLHRMEARLLRMVASGHMDEEACREAVQCIRAAALAASSGNERIRHSTALWLDPSCDNAELAELKHCVEEWSKVIASGDNLYRKRTADAAARIAQTAKNVTEAEAGQMLDILEGRIRGSGASNVNDGMVEFPAFEAALLWAYNK